VLTEEFTVRSHSDHLQNARIGLAIDEQQVGPEMALAMILPLASQSVITVFLGQSHVFDQERDHLTHEWVKLAPVLPFAFALEVAQAGSRPLNPQH
jgi:hypothetical protein